MRDQLGRAIAALGPANLVIDNFEHLTAAAGAVGRLSQRAGEARFALAELREVVRRVGIPPHAPIGRRVQRVARVVEGDPD